MYVLDRHLNFTMHVLRVCKSVSYYIKALRDIWTSYDDRYGENHCLHALSSCLDCTNTRLDYALALWFNSSASNVAKLQIAQNAVARVVIFFSTRRTEHIVPVLQQPKSICREQLP